MPSHLAFLWEREFPPQKMMAGDALQQARFFLWNGSALFLGTVEDATGHAHHALQIAIGLNSTFVLETSEETLECRSVLIAPDRPHRFRGRGDRQLIILLDTESIAAKHIGTVINEVSGFTEFDIELVRPSVEELKVSLEGCVDCGRIKAVVQQIISGLTGSVAASAAIDPRIQDALDFMKQQPDRKAPLAVIAETVGLSEGRLGHLFSEQIGIPIRRYLLWLRLIQAIDLLFKNVSLTAAAHDAGFADSAHFTRTFRRMFGVTPSELFKNSRFVQVIPCPE
jgi:AraC-like DNA-binding protein